MCVLIAVAVMMTMGRARTLDMLRAAFAMRAMETTVATNAGVQYLEQQKHTSCHYGCTRWS